MLHISDFSLFLKGIVIGFSIAAPVGPIGVLCIQRTLSGGMFRGLLSGLGAATADSIYGLIGVLGVTWVAKLLVAQQFWFRLLGGGFLCYLGVRTFRSAPAAQAAEGMRFAAFGAYGTTLLLTLTNPLTILAFAAIFAGLGSVTATANYFPASLFVLGVFVGSSLWWCVLSSFTTLLRGRFTQRRLAWVNRISGSIIVIFGLLALISLYPGVFRS